MSRRTMKSLDFIFIGDEILPGNNGMLDQIEALKWVQKNIKGKTVLKPDMLVSA